MAHPRRHFIAALMTVFGLNWLTAFGGMMAGVSVILIIGFLLLGTLGLTESPYIGIMAFMILPMVFIGGLLLIPIGALLERRQRIRAGEGKSCRLITYPVIDLGNPHIRHVAAIVLVLTVFNLLIIATVSYKGVVFMESVTFCGRVCHTVMEPEYTSYLDSPHSSVKCVECHIGPGAPWFVRSKLSGLGQVLAVTFDTYDRPIPAPVENLRPSRETCEECHWPDKFSGDRVKILTKYQEDEANTPLETVLLMHIGGGRSKGKGIHSWHISPDKKTTYLADAKRSEISRVRVDKADGSSMVFEKPAGASGEAQPAQEERVMDCLDCHNRPTHIFRTPERAVDEALSNGLIDASLPYIKKAAVQALTEAKGDNPDDSTQITESIRSFYQKEKPEVVENQAEKLDQAIQQLQAIYARNVFPDMDVTWGTYRNHLGHEDSPGCFRCHNDTLKTADGKTIGQDCTICHSVLAWDEENPEILKKLEIE